MNKLLIDLLHRYSKKLAIVGVLALVLKAPTLVDSLSI